MATIRTTCNQCDGIGHKIKIIGYKRTLCGDNKYSKKYHCNGQCENALETYKGDYLPCSLCGGYGTLKYILCLECSGGKKHNPNHHHDWFFSDGRVYSLYK